MTDEVSKEPTQTRDASKDAFKAIYQVIIGIAVTDALARVFLDHGDFVGLQILEAPHLVAIVLLLGFLPTAIRFVHGASIHMDTMHKRRYKVAWDFVGFLTQACLLYVMAEALEHPKTFSALFAFMLVFDTIWLVLLRLRGYLIFSATEWQWLFNNAALLVCMLLIFVTADHTRPILSASLIATVSILATVADYAMNLHFYFPISAAGRDERPYVTTDHAPL